MEVVTFTLVPFEPLPAGVELAITGTVTRRADALNISYLMAGDLDAVSIPALNTATDRQNRLWEKTCLEFFLAAPSPKAPSPKAPSPKAPSQKAPSQKAQQSSQQKSDRDRYWEFNLSPTGAWNVFALDGYRAGLREEAAFRELPFTVARTSAGLRLEAAIEMGALALAPSPWLLGVSAVCVLADGKETFWAIAHPGPTADFHQSQSFRLQLSP